MNEVRDAIDMGAIREPVCPIYSHVLRSHKNLPARGRSCAVCLAKTIPHSLKIGTRFSATDRNLLLPIRPY